jgi:predicted phosphoribosyltransferase
MKTRFKNRQDAGVRLAAKLSGYARQPNVLVLALPRGGVPVAAEVARALRAPWDVLVVRKLGVPGQEELAMGAIASGRVRVLNRPVLTACGVGEDALERVVAREQRELARREKLYRGNRPPCPVASRTIILVDDGVATGSTVRAALAALRSRGADRVIVAAPVIAADTKGQLEREADDVIAVLAPADFDAVGAWYEDFSATTDEEVTRLVGESAHCEAERGA